MQGKLARAVWADAPFNVKINGHVSGLGKTKHREFVQAFGEMTEDEFIAFLASYLELTKQHSEAGALNYACMDGAHGFELLTAARRAQLTFKVTCTWAKTAAGMGSLYRQQTESVHVFKNGGSEVKHVNNTPALDTGITHGVDPADEARAKEMWPFMEAFIRSGGSLFDDAEPKKPGGTDDLDGEPA